MRDSKLLNIVPAHAPTDLKLQNYIFYLFFSWLEVEKLFLIHLFTFFLNLKVEKRCLFTFF